MLKVIYLNGPYHQWAYSRSSRSPAVTKSGTIYYPIWLAYAAGFLRQQLPSARVELVDAVARRFDRAALIKHLQNDPPDLLFCDTSTPSISEDVKTACAVKDAFGRCRVVMVGTHATALPDEVLQSDRRIDAVARGEYDQTAVELAQAMSEGQTWHNVAGVTFREQDKIIYNPERELISNLDTLPWVSRVYRDFLSVRDYFFAAAQYPMVMIITSRGCPHRCGWCLYPQVMHQGKYRVRSSEDVAAEFAFIADEMPGVREVGIEDDLFTADRNRLHRICRQLIRQKNRLNFWCDTRVDLDYESMRLLKQAGCRLVIVGFESGEQAILDGIHKGTRADRAYQFMADARQAKLLVHGCFVLGNPGETRQTMQATLELAKKLDPDTVQFFPMIVYPGTEMFRWARENNYLVSRDYRRWLTGEGLHNSVVDLPGLPGEEVLRFCDFARREFYLRRGYLLRKLAQSFVNLQEARRNIKAFRRFARYLVKAT